MGIRSQLAHIRAAIAFAPATINTATTTAGTVIDTARHPSVGVMWGAHAYTAGDFTALIEEADNVGMTGAVALTEKRLDLDAATVSAAVGTGFYRRIEMISTLQFLRFSIVSANSPNANLSAFWMIEPDVKPGV